MCSETEDLRCHLPMSRRVLIDGTTKQVLYDPDLKKVLVEPGEDCSVGASALIEVHATGSGTGCQTFDITDSLTATLPPGGGFAFLTTSHDCLSGCSTPSTYAGTVAYLGSIFCSGSSFQLFIQGISACCYGFSPDCHTNVSGCSCSSANGAPGTMTAPGVYTFNFTGTVGGLTWNLDVTVTITFP